MRITKSNIFVLTQWPVNKAPPSGSQSSITLGLLLNSDHAEAVLDTGPSADSTEVSSYAFRMYILVQLNEMKS